MTRKAEKVQRAYEWLNRIPKPIKKVVKFNSITNISGIQREIDNSRHQMTLFSYIGSRSPEAKALALRVRALERLRDSI
jgi:hypothetical protein